VSWFAADTPVISSIRYQFQLMRRKISGEYAARSMEDYDLQAVIDYALDKRSTGLIDDRLYTRSQDAARRGCPFFRYVQLDCPLISATRIIRTRNRDSGS
jgi:nitric oxide reductase activation protein